MAKTIAQQIGIFLINLDRSPERLARFKGHADVARLRYERIRAIDGPREVPEWLRSQFPANSRLKPGEIGCYASHLCVCKEVVDRNLDGAIVLEDDIAFVPEFELLAMRALEKAPPSWDIIHLSSDFKRPAYPISRLTDQHTLVRFARMPAGSAAYAISRAGALKLLAHGVRAMPFDMEFRYAWLRELEVFGVSPAPAWQQFDLPSTITTPRTNVSATNLGSSLKNYDKPSIASQLKGRIYVHGRLGVRGQLYVLGRSVFGR